jgi:flagellar hook-associated protein 1 FlgK
VTGLNVTDTINQVNSIGSQIAQLNDAIAKATASGDTPNDLLDKRDVMIDQLSQLGNVTLTNTTLGQVDVAIGGAALVTGATSATLAESDMTSLTSGKLAGLIALRDTTIPGYQSQLDTLASTLITATNTQHAAGFDLNGNPGGAFFSGTSAATIGVSAAITANPALIAASGNGTPGNSDNALALAGIRNQALIGASTIDTAYSQLVTKVGSDTQQAHTSLATAELLTNSLQDKRDSVSGVSLDEEMTNLVRYQRGYQASSRAMSAMDDMLDTLISRTGRVGL